MPLLRVLEAKAEISDAQRRFEGAFEHLADERIPVVIGHPGDSWADEVLWSAHLGIWACSTFREGKHWNGFGIGKPVPKRNVSITCEINFHPAGIYRRVAGAIAANDLGNVYVVHRGTIHISKGSGKALFGRHYRGEWIIVDDGECESRVALVGALDSPRFARQVCLFVHEVSRIKRLASSGEQQSAQDVHPLGSFQEEFSGTRAYSVRQQIEARCDHGLVVNGLASALVGRGHTVGNDRSRDLFVSDRAGQVTWLFEVKTDTMTTSVYTAVGQLMLYSVGLRGNPTRVLVVPEKVGQVLEAALHELGIELLVYEWQGDEIVIVGLESLGL